VIPLDPERPCGPESDGPAEPMPEVERDTRLLGVAILWTLALDLALVLGAVQLIRWLF
jgi:hypothetical protein